MTEDKLNECRELLKHIKTMETALCRLKEARTKVAEEGEAYGNIYIYHRTPDGYCDSLQLAVRTDKLLALLDSEIADNAESLAKLKGRFEEL